MSYNIRYLIVICGFILLGFLLVPSKSNPSTDIFPKPFILEVVRETRVKTKFKQIFYVNDSQICSEIIRPSNGEKITTILDVKGKKITALLNEKKEFFITKMILNTGNDDFLDIDFIFDSQANIEFLQTEKIDGRKANKFLLSKPGKAYLYCWTDAKTNRPFRLSDYDNEKVVYIEKFEQRELPAEKFTPPENFVEIESPIK